MTIDDHATFRDRLALKPVLLAGSALAVLVAVIVIVFSSSGGSTPDATAEGASAPVALDAQALLALADTNASEALADVFGQLRGGDVSEAQSRRLTSILLVTLGGNQSVDGSADESALLESLARRLEVDESVSLSLDEVLSRLVAEIDPDGEITSEADLLAAVEAWARANPANTLLLGAPETAAGPLSGLSGLSFDELVAELDQLELAAGDIVLPIDGVTGLGVLRVPRVRWEVDPTVRAVTFTGGGNFSGRSAEVVISVLYG